MKKVVIIEDDSTLRDVYKTLLTQNGYEVTTSGTGHEGLGIVKTVQPDLVILDIMLPDGMNGFDVLEYIRRFPQTQNIKVLILTNLDSEAETAKSIGANDYLVKVSTDNAAFVTKVKALIGV